MRQTFRKRKRGLARRSRTVNCSKNNTTQRSDGPFWPAMTTLFPQTMMLVSRKPSTLEVKYKRLAPSSRKYKDVERADNQWTHQPTPTSTSLVILLIIIIWSGMVANWPKTKFRSEWTWDNIKIRPNSMLVNRGTQQPIKLSHLETNLKRQIRSCSRQTRPSITNLRINIMRRMLVKSCTWCAEMTCMKT